MLTLLLLCNQNYTFSMHTHINRMQCKCVSNLGTEGRTFNLQLKLQNTIQDYICKISNNV